MREPCEVSYVVALECGHCLQVMSIADMRNRGRGTCVHCGQLFDNAHMISEADAPRLHIEVSPEDIQDRAGTKNSVSIGHTTLELVLDALQTLIPLTDGEAHELVSQLIDLLEEERKSKD